MLNVIEIERVANEAISAADAHGRRRGRRGRRGPMNLTSSVKRFRAQVSERVRPDWLYTEEEIVGLGIPAATVRAGVLSRELQGQDDGDDVGNLVFRGGAILEWIRVAGIDEATPKTQTTNTIATPTGAARRQEHEKMATATKVDDRATIIAHARLEYQRKGGERQIVCSCGAWVNDTLREKNLATLTEDEMRRFNIRAD